MDNRWIVFLNNYFRYVVSFMKPIEKVTILPVGQRPVMELYPIIRSVKYRDIEGELQKKWDSATFPPNQVLDELIKIIVTNKMRYQVISNTLGMPWQVVAAIHYRESDLDFTKCLHNGDPLPGPTTHVPIGRGPFRNWFAATLDALRLKDFFTKDPWGWPFCLYKLEGYNGFGYRLKHNINSPYVYSGTQFYTCGKYATDGQFDPGLADKQFGCLVILKKLEFV